MLKISLALLLDQHSG